jgi:hypothetical protein
MPIPLPMLSWSDLADFQMRTAAAGSALLAAIVGARAARRLRVPQFGWAAALVGAGSTVFSLMPSMILFGSVGGGLYALLAMVVRTESVLVGKIFVVIATALGCTLVAWVLCLVLLSFPALVAATRRRTGSP